MQSPFSIENMVVLAPWKAEMLVFCVFYLIIFVQTNTFCTTIFLALVLFFFIFFNYLLFRLTEAKVTENWLLQAHGLTYLQTLRQCNAKVCHLSIFSSLLIRCMPVSALMTIIHTLSSDNKRNSIICDPWLEHCSLGILKKYFYSFISTFSVTNQGGIEETFIHSVIHVLILC